MTVKELIDILNKLPDDTVVMKRRYFQGESYEFKFDPTDFHYRMAKSVLLIDVSEN